jgi:peptide/nickel transport system ATP-binding protein
LKELQRELGVAYLFITHNFGVVEYLAHQIAVMKNGRLVEIGSADDILYRPQHEYTRALLAAVPRLKRQAA